MLRKEPQVCSPGCRFTMHVLWTNAIYSPLDAISRVEALGQTGGSRAYTYLKNPGEPYVMVVEMPAAVSSHTSRDASVRFHTVTHLSLLGDYCIKRCHWAVDCAPGNTGPRQYNPRLETLQFVITCWQSTNGLWKRRRYGAG